MSKGGERGGIKRKKESVEESWRVSLSTIHSCSNTKQIHLIRDCHAGPGPLSTTYHLDPQHICLSAIRLQHSASLYMKAGGLFSRPASGKGVFMPMSHIGTPVTRPQLVSVLIFFFLRVQRCCLGSPCHY